jgi:hypothetical protein
VDTPAANRLATTEISPSLHDCTSPIEAVGAPICSLHRRPDLMAQRFFEEITWKTGILVIGLLHTRRRNLVAAPSLKAPMHGFVVRISTGVENPQRCFQYRLTASSTVRDVLFPKMASDASPLIVRQSNHPTFINSTPVSNFEIAS